MTKVRVFDIEADGLELDDVNTVHCVVVKDILTDEFISYPEDYGSIGEILDYLGDSDVLIGHNIIHYDLPVLDRLYGFKYDGTIIDTLVVSRLLNPDRKRPLGYTGRDGAHSLGAWGYRLGKKKPEHEDWETYSPEMLHRCKEDVLINEQLYYTLLGEAEHP